MKAARAEGVNDARHVASQERAGLQQDQQERLQQLQAQEQQVCCPLSLSITIVCIRHARSAYLGSCFACFDLTVEFQAPACAP